MFVFASTAVLGLILGIAMLVVGETSMNGELEFDFGPFDGFWIIFGLPILAVVLFLILSPFSYWVSRIFWSEGDSDE